VHAAAVAVILMPWNPAVWWMASRIRLAAEIDCDSRVLAGGWSEDVGRYGETLLAVAAGKSRARLLLMPAMIETPSSLARRIAAMCAGPVPFRRAKRTAAGVGAALLLVAACSAPPPTSATDPSPDINPTLTPAPAVAREVLPDPPSPSNAAPDRQTAATPEPVDLEREVTPAAPEASIVRPGPGVANPVVLRSVRPQYTQDAMRRKVQGIVQLEVVVDPTGSVVGVEVLKSLDPELDAEAVKAARQWVFRPATIDGKPVSIMVMLELGFTLH
jgi:TonB family protein